MGTADIIEKNNQLFLIYPLLNFEMIMTGPNDSSRAMYMLSRTSVKTVGSKKNPADTASLHCDVSACSVENGDAGDPAYLPAAPASLHTLMWLPL